MTDTTPAGDPVTRLGERISVGELRGDLARLERKVDRMRVVQWAVGTLVAIGAVAQPAASYLFGSDAETRIAQAKETAAQEIDDFRPEVTAVRLEVIALRTQHAGDVGDLRQRIDYAPMSVARKALPR